MGLVLIVLFVSAWSCDDPAPKGSITATTKLNSFGGEVTIKGTGFPAGHTIRFKYQAIPNFDGAFSPPVFASVNPQGSFEVTDTSVRCTTQDRETDWPNVMIVAEDSAAPAPENPVTTVRPGIWICR
jgi:hypothetical protein